MHEIGRGPWTVGSQRVRVSMERALGERAETPHWSFRLLGRLSADTDGRRVERFPQQKVASLLAFLAYRRGKPQTRDVLVEVLWPECDPHAGRNRLSTTLSLLRQLLDTRELPSELFLPSDRLCVTLCAHHSWTDTCEFERLLQRARDSVQSLERIRHLTAAVHLYQGELLPGLYDEWIFSERERLGALYYWGVHRLVLELEAQGDPDSALPYALDAVRADPLREEGHRDLIRLYLAAGQPGAAQQQYRHLTQVFDRELNREPSAETTALLGASSSRMSPSRIELRRAESAGPNLQKPAEGGTGGALPIASPWYIERQVDGRLTAALARGDSVVVLKGPAQSGKSSLLGRAADDARRTGRRAVLLSLAALSPRHLDSPERLLLTLAEWLADCLALSPPAELWDPRVAPGLNLWRYVERKALADSLPLVWAVDDVDRLFECSFGDDVFALFRSWHNERSASPTSAWSRLTLVLACATEAHLYIRDLNQSPFNVGTRLEVGELAVEHAVELNKRHGSPLADDAQVRRFHGLVGGHPYLLQRGLHALSQDAVSLDYLEREGHRDDGPFGDTIRRHLLAVQRDPVLVDGVRAVLSRGRCPDEESFFRLRSSGLLAGEAPSEARFRCPIFERYFRRRLTSSRAVGCLDTP